MLNGKSKSNARWWAFSWLSLSHPFMWEWELRTLCLFPPSKEPLPHFQYHLVENCQMHALASQRSVIDHSAAPPWPLFLGQIGKYSELCICWWSLEVKICVDLNEFASNSGGWRGENAVPRSSWAVRNDSFEVPRMFLTHWMNSNFLLPISATFPFWIFRWHPKHHPFQLRTSNRFLP